MNTGGRLAGVTPPAMPTVDDTSFAAAKSRVETAFSFVKSLVGGQDCRRRGGQGYRLDWRRQRPENEGQGLSATVRPAEFLLLCNNGVQHPASSRRTDRKAGLPRSGADWLSGASRVWPKGLDEFSADGIAMLSAALHMSAFGTSRHFAAAQRFGRFRSKADIEPRSPSRIYEYTAKKLLIVSLSPSPPTLSPQKGRGSRPEFATHAKILIRHGRACHRKSGLPDLRHLIVRNSGKPEFRCHPRLCLR